MEKLDTRTLLETHAAVDATARTLKQPFPMRLNMIFTDQVQVSAR